MKLGHCVASILALLGSGALATANADGDTLVHDAEYYIAEKQNAERWATDDKAVDQKLSAFRERNEGKPPNIDKLEAVV